MNLKQFFIALAILFTLSASATVTVTNVVCQQQYPWNGKVDIDYEIVADDPDADVWIFATGFDQDANQSMAVRSVTGDGAVGPVKPGTHRMTWNVTADYPGFNSTTFNVKLTALTGGSPYMVIDLSDGPDAQNYPVTYLNQVPAGGWTDEYKTTKIVLRLLPPGTFMMGSPRDEIGRNESTSYGNYYDYECLHAVNITKPFYIGVFEVTQRQWYLVMGSKDACYRTGDNRPVDRVTYDDIRGAINGAAWPTHNQVDADTFIGRLRSKANMLFDLPTEAQWEYACRANTSTAWNDGTTCTNYYNDGNLSRLGRYSYNGEYSDGPAIVGSYLPNAWGLYDMHGNVTEWCLDYYGERINDYTPEIDPVGPNTGSQRVIRGGYWSSSFASYCRSAWRSKYNPSERVGTYYSSYVYYGFRIVLVQ